MLDYLLILSIINWVFFILVSAFKRDRNKIIHSIYINFIWLYPSLAYIVWYFWFK
jgi:hypothetical protein